MSEHLPYRQFKYNQDILIGPGNFDCSLGEPEDRIWSRDLKSVVDELNRLHALLVRSKDCLEKSGTHLSTKSLLSADYEESSKLIEEIDKLIR